MDETGSAFLESEQYSPLTLEQRGIDLIPDSDRHGKPVRLFWLWSGGLWSVNNLLFGALLFFFGVSFAQAIAVIVVGNLISWVLLGLASLPGPRTGTSAFVISRAPFGPNGARGVSVFNWLTLVGYEALNLAIIVLALLAILAKAGLGGSAWLKTLLIIVVCVVNLPLPLYGHAMVMAALRWLSYLFIPISVLLTILVLPKVHIGSIHTHATWVGLSSAFSFILIAGGLGYINVGSDYSRYLPKDASKVAIVSWVTLAAMIPCVLLEIVGYLVSSVVPTASDVVSGFPVALPGWFAVPYLLFVVVQLFALNTFNLYSSGLTLQAIGVRLKRWKCTLIDLTICMVLLFVIIFSQVFNTFLSEFLLTTIIWVAPWAAVFVVDWAMRRGNYDLLSLFGEGGAIYWRTRGVFLPGIAALVGGMVAAGLYINTELYVGPLSAITQKADFSAAAGLVVAGVLYYLLARRGVAEEVKQSSNAQPTAAAAPAHQARPPSAARMDSLLHRMGWASGRPRSSPGR